MTTVASYGPIQLADALGLPRWKVRHGIDAGLIPAADTAGRWSQALVDEVAADLTRIVAAIEDQAEDKRGFGAPRLANLLAERTGLAVRADDVRVLDERELVRYVDEYKGHALYSVRDAERYANGGDFDELAVIVAEREAWTAASLSRRATAERLHWSCDELDRVAATGRIVAGPMDRFAIADVDALAADEDLTADIEGARLLTADRAAQHLEIRRTDWDWAVAAGWITPAKVTSVKVGARRWIEVPLYRTGDVDALRDLPGVDWEAVRAVRPGGLSLLREFARRATNRATDIREFADEMTRTLGAEVVAWFDTSRGVWALRWTVADDVSPSDDAWAKAKATQVAQVAIALAGHAKARRHADAVVLDPRRA